MRRILFVTGTDTGVGKTLLTALLLLHLRERGVHALATKPFASGDPADTRLLAALQPGELADKEVTPFSFPEPVAPLVAARRHRRPIAPGEVAAHVERLADRCECLLVEGCGGVKVPLAPGYCVADLIRALQCPAVVVARNALGTINHSCLTVDVLRHGSGGAVRLVLMDQRRPDASAASNLRVLRELCCGIEVDQVRFLGSKPLTISALKQNCRILKKTLARILGMVIF